MKYVGYVGYYASKRVIVEASSIAAAEDLMLEEAGNICLCHQCARGVDIGDAYEVTEIELVE